MKNRKNQRPFGAFGFSRMVKLGGAVAFALLLCFGYAEFDASAKKSRSSRKTTKTTQTQKHKKKRQKRNRGQKYPQVEEEVFAIEQATQIAIVDKSEVKNEVLSQEEQQEYDLQCVVANHNADVEQVFSVTEVQAQFPGGMQALMNWLAGHLAYPEEAWKNNIQGRVIVQFIVNADGSVSEARVVKSVDKYLDAEALRVVGMMPKWIPGKNAGKVVRSYFILPISFKIPEEEAVQIVSQAGGCANGDCWKQVSSIPQRKKVQESPSLYNQEAAEDDYDAEIYRPAEERIYTVVEQQAQFPGGQQALIQWVEDNIKCPERVKNSDTKVRVIVKFVVEKDGSVTNPVVVKGVDNELDKAAIELMEKMPRWIPGRMNGVPVRSYYIIPVLFNRRK